jgi:hypothetical protein
MEAHAFVVGLRRLRTLSLLAVVAFSAASVSAADEKPGTGSMVPEHGSMPGMGHSSSDVPPHSQDTAAASSSSTTAYQAAMMKMHENQQIEFTGDPDRDFVKHMIPHHQGAIDMARVELHYGHDSEIRKLAEKIIADQQKEIEVMQKWLDTHSMGK